MKNINVGFTDEEFARLASHKAFLMMDWHEYIIACSEYARNLEFEEKHAINTDDLKIKEAKEKT